ncbi:MAG: HAD family hydrolase [Planctomycetota bacterium]|nr:MAG: HAD family hydrolase [Planctomycetota bacterium]
MPIRAISFDFHGTLALPYPSPGAIYAEVAADYGLKLPVSALDQRFPEAFMEVRRGASAAYGADESDARDFWFAVVRATFQPLLTPEAKVSDTLCMALFAAFGEARHWRLLPEAQACLSWCAKAGLPVAICSNFDARIHRLVAAHGLGPCAQVLPSTLVGTPKPDPELLLLAMSLLEVEPEELLHVGDNQHEDGGAAQAAGCPWLEVARDHGVQLAALQSAIQKDLS